MDGDFLRFFVLVHPWRSLPWSSSSVKTLCSYILDYFVRKSQEKPVAPENRSVRETHIRDSQDQKKAFKLILCSLPSFRLAHLFLRILFSFFLPCPPHPSPGTFLPQNPPLSGTWGLLFLVQKRQPARAGFWGRFWTGSPHRKKRKILFFWRARKGELAMVGKSQERNPVLLENRSIRHVRELQAQKSPWSSSSVRTLCSGPYHQHQNFCNTKTSLARN